MSLRPYQEVGLKEISQHYVSGTRKVLLHLATGGGKTVVFSEALKRTAARGAPAIMVVRGRHLVDQASARLMRERVPHGVLMARHWNYRPNELIQICSIDTLMARDLRPPARLVVVDEAHLFLSEGCRDFVASYQDSFILSVTATPYVDKSLRHIADVVVKPVGICELIRDGYLVDARYFAPSSPDLTDVKISAATKDFEAGSLSEAMQAGSLVGDLVHHWIKHGENRSTIIFASSIGHSKNIVQQFCDNGVKAEHCDADTKDAERKAILGRLERGETRVVSNVGILCTGVDLPFVSCLVMARPTKSYNLYIQQLGRGTRPFTGKRDFIVLDHAGNVLRHGFITEEQEANLDGKLAKKGPPAIRVCSACYAAFYGFRCACGYEVPLAERERKVLEVEGDLAEITELPFEAQVQREIEKLKKERKAKGYKRGWVFYRLVDMYGQEVAERFMPKRKVPAWVR